MLRIAFMGALDSARGASSRWTPLHTEFMGSNYNLNEMIFRSLLGQRARVPTQTADFCRLADLGLVADGGELADAALVDLEHGHHSRRASTRATARTARGRRLVGRRLVGPGS